MIFGLVLTDRLSVAGNGLRRAHIRAKRQIAAKCADSYCQHYPTIVGHKQEPIILIRSTDVVLRNDSRSSHDEEAVEDLNSVQNCLDYFSVPLSGGLAIHSYQKR